LGSKEAKGWGAGFGIEEKGCHPWIGEEAGQFRVKCRHEVEG
jgi:hypothetical protein